MIDIIILICCTVGGFVIGKYLERRIREKDEFYQDLTSYVILLKDNVIGRRLSMTEFNREYSQSCGAAFGEYINSGKISVRLSKSEKSNLSYFFDNLDCVSSQALIEHIDYRGKILVENAKKVMQEETSKASIYAKLGLLVGAMIGILFV